MSSTNNNKANRKAAPQPTKALGPYSPVRQAGDFYFLAGHTGFDAARGTADADIVAQTRQALNNLAATLDSAGLALNDVIKTTIFVTDMGDFGIVNEVYVSYFAEPRPARSTVAVKELPRIGNGTPLKIEIEAVAYAPRPVT